REEMRLSPCSPAPSDVRGYKSMRLVRDVLALDHIEPTGIFGSWWGVAIQRKDSTERRYSMPISGAAQCLAFTASESGLNLQGLAGDEVDPWPETRDAGQGGVVMLNHLARSQVAIALGALDVF